MKQKKKKRKGIIRNNKTERVMSLKDIDQTFLRKKQDPALLNM